MPRLADMKAEIKPMSNGNLMLFIYRTEPQVRSATVYYDRMKLTPDKRDIAFLNRGQIVALCDVKILTEN